MGLKKWLSQKPYSLSLSAGFFGFYAHCGFTKALWEHGHKPERIMGSSAGALLGSLISAGHSVEEIQKIITQFRKDDFWDRKIGFGLLEGNKFKKLLERYLPAKFSDLKIPLTVAAHPVYQLRSMRFEDGDLIPAVQASCCFPGLFHPVKIDDKLYIDGGVTDWAGNRSARPGEKILLHYLRPSGPHSLYIQAQVFRRLNKDHHVVSFDDIKELGPSKMDRGHEVIEHTYQKTRKLLTTGK